MKSLSLCFVLLCGVTGLAAAPVVTNVMAAQSGNLVLISYNLANAYNLPCEVSLQASNDGGSSYTIFPASLSGDYCTIATTASGSQYQIFWYYGLDGVGNGNNYRVKVLADDGAGAVAQPVLDPSGGTYDNGVAVSISCATDGATIRYTVDGSEPDSSSPVYASPIYIVATSSLKVKGFKPGWTPSAIASATYTITSSPGQMIYVPGGTIYPKDGIYIAGLTVSDFYIGKYELTIAQLIAGVGFSGGDDYPTDFLRWFGAITYCNRRSMLEGLTPCYSYLDYGTNPDDWPSGWNRYFSSYNNLNVSCDWNANGYRLPTEAEWEYAARGGLQTHGYTYSGSNDLNEVGWYQSNSGYKKHTVGQLAPNELGIYDMSGNLMEWCWDRESQTSSNRVVRGGYFGSNAYSCTVSDRYSSGYSVTFSVSHIGFRICRTSL